MTPEDYLTLARDALNAPAAGEAQRRAAVRFAYDSLFLSVAGWFGLDPATFAGNDRAVREALFAGGMDEAPPFLRLARRHWNTLWLASLRGQRALGESITETDARLSLALAEQVFAARSAGLQ
ncbi:hypothetical protein [Azospirillum sp. SYSU D00513]|uniref:hypothetical protein n=1 Tax=Azospirillum sp. SYSU D00513 TaxID=2812561 RepID=UPI001A96187A|nr:hypothetical protein [Azospirillum sp. SYSU D00513]